MMSNSNYLRTEQQAYSARLWQVFACPECGGVLSPDDDGAHCLNCWTAYNHAVSGALDLRHAKAVSLEIAVGCNPLPDYPVNFDPLPTNPNPEVDFSEITLPHNLSPKFCSYLPKAKRDDSLMLDLGCGQPIYRTLAEHAGYEYVGLDFQSPHAPLLGDAQALPFQDDSVELIWSNAVFQYLPCPLVMAKEAYRVLQPGGTFLGTAGFIEPFDGDSFQMLTRLGLLHLLHAAGFKVLHISPDSWWTGLVALSRMGLFPRMPATLSRLLVLPLESLSKVWWQFGARRSHSANEANRLARVTGGHQFIAMKV
ncbi:MAG: class I SAM-dependent methyltransferase [Anaerolineae bacterium]